MNVSRDFLSGSNMDANIVVTCDTAVVSVTDLTWDIDGKCVLEGAPTYARTGFVLFDIGRAVRAGVFF